MTNPIYVRDDRRLALGWIDDTTGYTVSVTMKGRDSEQRRIVQWSLGLHRMDGTRTTLMEHTWGDDLRSGATMSPTVDEMFETLIAFAEHECDEPSGMFPGISLDGLRDIVESVQGFIWTDAPLTCGCRATVVPNPNDLGDTVYCPRCDIYSYVAQDQD